MADVKISALPAASTPLAGTEVLPIVQSGTTDQVSVANLTAGRTVNGAAFTATGTVSGATVTASGTVSGATVSGTTVSGTTVSGITVNVGAGTVSAPSISPTGDSNTGIFFPAADTIAFAEGGVEALRLDSTGNATFTGTAVMSSSFLRNKIINGAMEIDQRNAGAAQNNVANLATYFLDRFAYFGTTAARFSIGQNVGAVTPPAGFSNYLGLSSLAATTPVASDIYAVGQRIEGVNIPDLAWGTASARSITLSFWVRSSATGTFGGSLANSAVNRAYVFSYTIGAANTWEYKTITVPGDTTGTWLTTTGTGIILWFNFASGSSNLGTAGSWGSSLFYGPTGAVNVLANNSATFYLTGVQLEVGTVATPFERRQYGQELGLCQRFYYVGPTGLYGYPSPSTGGFAAFQRYDFKVTMRATPTVSTNYTSLNNVASITASTRTQDFFMDQIVSTTSTNTTWNVAYTASAEL